MSFRFAKGLTLVATVFGATVCVTAQDRVVWAQQDTAGSKSNAPLEVGDKAPNFKLKKLDGSQFELAKNLEDGPTVLVTLRGFPGYQCPACTGQVADFVAAHEKFQAHKARVILVYPGPAANLDVKAKEFFAETKLPENFTVLLDPDYSFTNAYGLRWDAPRETAYPTTILLSEKGEVKFINISKSHGGRVPAQQIVDLLQ